MESRQFLRLSRRLKLLLSTRHLRCASSKPLAASQRQANPIGGYYESILSSSSPSVASVSSTIASPSNPSIATVPAPEPSILFSSRLSSPLERRFEIEKRSKRVGGILVPPKPEEPDNCCMSGCVNCVWDRYRDEIEEWAVAKKMADDALQKEGQKKRKKKGQGGTGLMPEEGGRGVQHMLVSMDDDGGGSESNWETRLDPEYKGEELFNNIPVGIREFMKQEKRLKEKHAKEGNTG